ncbi:hypothetical protein [Arthrobacter pityocampae]|uniref:hypothetical protein n=1 Tax=Arthrobacter pityocampae TaxID=547334 RepID=UPI00373514B5
MILDLGLAVTTMTPSGDPTLKPGLDPASVTPGTLGFLATLFVVVLVILLIRDMTKRIRRVRYTAEVDQARALREDDGVAPGPDGAPGAGGEAGRRAPGTDGVGRPMPGGKHGPDNR